MTPKIRLQPLFISPSEGAYERLNSFRVGLVFGLKPRVARGAQPWAVLQNPVGIQLQIKGVRLKEGGMKIFKGQRPDTYQPGLPSPGLVHLYFQGLKAQHKNYCLRKGSMNVSDLQPFGLKRMPPLGLAAQAGMYRAVGAGGIE